ncbi:hypothetical protein JCM8547_004270 [Rhodosporidiobolus lusitaniae]
MVHELKVEGDKVIETDDQGNVVSTKNYTSVHAGYAATAHNKRYSDETRENAENIMHDLEAAHDAGMQGEDDSKPSGSPKRGAKPAGEHHISDVTRHHHEASKSETQHASEVHDHRRIGGLKAALHNPNTSEEGKERVRGELEEMGVDPDSV